jgi:MSHA biogenesis protein MshI
VFPFGRKSQHAGKVACAVHGAQASWACVQRSANGLPQVLWVESTGWTEDGRAGRELRQRRGLSRTDSVAVLARGQYQVLQVDAPELPRAEWTQALRWQIKDRLDFPVEQAVIQVLELPSDPVRKANSQLMAVAAANGPLQGLIARGDQVGLDWSAIDIPETALRNISALVEPADKAQALVHIGDEHALLVITVGGELASSRQLDMALGPLNSSDDNTRQAAFDRAGLELQRTLDGFERHFNHLSLSRLLIAPAVGLEAFMAHLRELVYVPVEPLDLSAVLDTTAAEVLTNPAQLSLHLCAIGAALRTH